MLPENKECYFAYMKSLNEKYQNKKSRHRQNNFANMKRLSGI